MEKVSTLFLRRAAAKVDGRSAVGALGGKRLPAAKGAAAGREPFGESYGVIFSTIKPAPGRRTRN